jgi:hypothetical protein
VAPWASSAAVHLQHDVGRFLARLGKVFLEDVDDEFHRRVVVVEKDHLEHHNTRDKTANLAGLDQKLPRLVQLARDIQIQAHAEVRNRRETVPCEDRHEDRKSEDKAELEQNLRAAPRKNQNPALEKGEELAGRRGQFMAWGSVRRFRGGVGFERFGLGLGFGGFFNRLLVFFPGRRPFPGLAEFKPFVELVGGIHTEVMGEKLGRAMVSHHAAVENEHRIVEFQMLEAVGHRKDETVFLAGETVQELHDLVL